jgi:hypothetical protein
MKSILFKVKPLLWMEMIINLMILKTHHSVNYSKLLVLIVMQFSLVMMQISSKEQLKEMLLKLLLSNSANMKNQSLLIEKKTKEYFPFLSTLLKNGCSLLTKLKENKTFY